MAESLRCEVKVGALQLSEAMCSHCKFIEADSAGKAWLQERLVKPQPSVFCSRECKEAFQRQQRRSCAWPSAG